MAKEMNKDTLVKKLKTVSNTQDSIPMLSLWIIHHKAHHKQIVDAWLDMLKKSKHQHRLTLLYLCNDVVQNCARKNAPIYKESFADVLAEAVTHLRDSSIKSSVQRVVKIWVKRSVFDTDFTDQLLASLITNTAPEKLRNKLLIEYKTTNLIDEIKKFKVIEDEIESDQIRLKAIRMDVSNIDAIRKLKDKIGGETFSREFEESATQLELFLKRYETYIEGRKNLLDLLDHGTVYYHAQYHEAKIVVNAYKSFENRVKKMKRGVDKVKERFPPLKDEDKNHGEDMEMSDDDQNINKKSNIISSVEPKHRKTLRINDKPMAIPPLPKGDESSASHVLKLLTTGIEGMKNSENVTESLKKVMTGLVKRPGMRGASFSSSDAITNEVTKTAKESFTIVRSVSETAVNNSTRSADPSKDPSPPSGFDSPPSPTGSPELNISSPPRMQSLDSRLADLFNEDGSAADLKSQTEASESDSDSDTDLIKRANRHLDKKQNSTLPGLGGLDEVAEPTPPQETPIESGSVKATPGDQQHNVETGEMVAATAQTTAPVARGTSYAPVANQAIPVIGGISRIAAPINDGSSTPTLDEKPYSPPLSDVSKVYVPPALTAAYSGNALSFLTKIMGTPTAKTDVAPAESTTLPAPAATRPSPIASNTLYSSWATHPPTWPRTVPTATTSALPSSMWSSPPPIPTLPPPPPIFSWAGNLGASTVAQPWQNSGTASARSTQVPLTEPPVSNIGVPTTPVTSNAVEVASQSFEGTIPVSRTSPHGALATAPPPAKKSKWDAKDTDYRSTGHEPSASVETNGKKPLLERRTSLINITFSSTAAAKLRPQQPAVDVKPVMNTSPQHLRTEVIPHPKYPGLDGVIENKASFNETVDLNSLAKQPLSHAPPPLTSPSGPKTYDVFGNLTFGFSKPESDEKPPEQITPITPPPKRFDIHPNSASRKHKIYDSQGNKIDSPESTIHQRIKEARMNASNTPPTRPRHEMPREPLDENPHFQPRFDEPRKLFEDRHRFDPGALSEMPRPRFEKTPGPRPDEPRIHHRMEKPNGPYGEIPQQRHPLDHPREPFHELSERAHLGPRLERPREPLHDIHHPYRPRSPPPLGFRSMGPRHPPAVRRRSANELLDAELEMLRRDEQRREEAMLRDAVLLEELDRRGPPRPPRPWGMRPRAPFPHHGPRGSPFRAARPRMRF